MIYLDNAATTHPKPEQVSRAMVGALEHIGANPGRSGHKMSLEAGRAVLKTREALADFFHLPDPMRIVFAFNCTDALNMAIKGCLLQGDHVVTTALEHNSVLRPLRGLEQRGIITLTLLQPQDGMVSAAQVAAAFTPSTRLCVVTQASNVTGAVQPIAQIGRICRHAGVIFLVDGAQGAGMLKTDIPATYADLYAFPGHKGLLGPQGTGGLYVREGLFLTSLREGGTGSSSQMQLQPSELPEAQESGTLNLPGICGLMAGVNFVREHQQEIAEHEQSLADMMREGLMNIHGVKVYGPEDKEKRVGLVSFSLGEHFSSEVADALDANDIAVRSGLHCAPAIHEHLGTLQSGLVRASVGFYNSLKDIDRFLLACSKL